MVNLEMREIREKLGTYIRNARDRKGLSQEKLGELSDLSTNHVSKIERGCSSVKFENLLKMCISLEISLDEFILIHVLSDDPQADEYRRKLSQMRSEEEILRLKENVVSAIENVYKANGPK